jgi:hypothetical protein
MKTLAELLACAKRELKMREFVYPKWCEEGRKNWTRDRAAHEIECMRGIVLLVEKQVALDKLSGELRLDYPEGKPASGWDQVRKAIEQ